MRVFSTLTSKIIPIPLKNIDTDMIIPAEFLKSTKKMGFGRHLFQRLRETDPFFPFNLEKYKNAHILCADENFGCGSSREHAVWALLDAGIYVVIAPSFADIFYNNAGKNGLVLITLNSSLVRIVLQMAEMESCFVSINLPNQTITLQDKTQFNFPFDPFLKECIVNGADELGYLLKSLDEIRRFKHIN